MIQWEQLCSVNLDVFLRACATFSLETAEKRVLDWKNPIRERWSSENSYVLSILEVYLRACATFSSETAEIRVLDWKTLSERDDPVRTAMFCRFGGVSTCVRNFLLRNSGNTSARLKNPIRERWSSENSYVLSILEVYLRACATFSLETAEIRVLDWKTLSERDDPVRAMFCQFGGVSTCVCNFLLGNSGDTSSGVKNPFRERWSSENNYVLSIWTCFYVREQLSP